MSNQSSNIGDGRLRDKLPIGIAYGLIIVFVGFGVSELLDITSITEIQTPIRTGDFAQITSAIGTTVLTLGLLLLYDKQARIQNQQAKIQNNQESLMEQQFTPYLTGEVTFLNITSVQFLIQNSGNGPAYNVSAEWEVADQEREWEVPTLSSNDEFGFPVIVDGDNWLLSKDEIQNYLEENDSSSEIEYRISCEDRFGKTHCFDGTVDFSVLLKRAESDEIWQEEPIREISQDLSKIQRDIRKISRYEKNKDKSANWKDRSKQTELIYNLISEHEELTLNELNSLTNLNERTIEYRVTSLDDIGAVQYNKNTNTVKSVIDNMGTTLNDF